MKTDSGLSSCMLRAQTVLYYANLLLWAEYRTCTISTGTVHVYVHMYTMLGHVFLCAVYHRSVHLLWPGEVGETEWTSHASTSRVGTHM